MAILLNIKKVKILWLTGLCDWILFLRDNLVLMNHLFLDPKKSSFVTKLTLAFTLRQLWNRPFSNTMSLTRPSVSCINWSKFSFLSMWDIVSTELLWTYSIQVSKNTTTKKQTAKASNTTNKKEKNEKGNNLWHITNGLFQAQMVSGDKKRALRANICMLTFPMHWPRAWKRLVPFLKIIVFKYCNTSIE